jgi:hypothetical protein
MEFSVFFGPVSPRAFANPKCKVHNFRGRKKSQSKKLEFFPQFNLLTSLCAWKYCKCQRSRSSSEARAEDGHISGKRKADQNIATPVPLTNII